MKKLLRILFLMSVFTVLLCATAMAAENEGICEVEMAENAAISVVAGTAEKDQLPITVTKARSGEEYLVVVSKDNLNNSSVTLNADNIVYIDQKSATGDTVSFNLYPSQLANDNTYYIYLSSTSTGLTEVGTFKYVVPYRLGFVDDDNIIDVRDATIVLQYAVKSNEALTSTQLLAANVDGNNVVDVRDAAQIIQYALKMIDEFIPATT